jgi:hypothetical protein
MGKSVEKPTKPEAQKAEDVREAQIKGGSWVTPVPQPSAHALAFDQLTADVREARTKTNVAGRAYVELYKAQKDLEFKLANFVTSRMGEADPIRVTT